MGTREITYGVDRQGKPALLTEKESIAQQFINGVFMVPGNLPNLPIGLNVVDYLFKEQSEVDEKEVSSILTKALGTAFMTKNIASLECLIVNVESNPTFLLLAHLKVDKEDDNKVLGLVITGQDDTVRFNYQFLSEGLRKAYGMERSDSTA